MIYRILIILASVISSFSCFADVTLPTVTVIGIIPTPGGFIFIPAVTGEFNSSAAYMQHAANVKNANAISDVRCVASGSRRFTTSLDDTLDRYLAAADVYNKIVTASAGMKSILIGSVINPSDGKAYLGFKITYADGGTEKWMALPDPRISTKLIDDPLPDSLVKGDGAVKASLWCGSPTG
jgi:hypothetical protein